MSALSAYAGVLLSIVGMMLIIAGVIVSGLFLPGVVVLVSGVIAFAVAGALPFIRRPGAAE